MAMACRIRSSCCRIRSYCCRISNRCAPGNWCRCHDCGELLCASRDRCFKKTREGAVIKSGCYSSRNRVDRHTNSANASCLPSKGTARAEAQDVTNIGKNLERGSDCDGYWLGASQVTKVGPAIHRISSRSCIRRNDRTSNNWSSDG